MVISTILNTACDVSNQRNAFFVAVHHFTAHSAPEGVNSAFDKATLKRLQDLQKLSVEDKGHVYALLDAFLLKCSIQKNLAVK